VASSAGKALHASSRTISKFAMVRSFRLPMMPPRPALATSEYPLRATALIYQTRKKGKVSHGEGTGMPGRT
jgi:hypothetical protein